MQNTSQAPTQGTVDDPPEILPCGLTAEEKSQWGDTMSLMAWTAPGFRHIFFKLLCNNDGGYYCVPTRKVPVAATDGKNIMVNPDTFFKKYALKERVFITAHEVVHNVYGDVELLHRCQATEKVPMHDGTSLPFDNKAMQLSMDYRINALLVASRIGDLPTGAFYDKKIAVANDSVLDVYKKVYKDLDDKGELGGPDWGGGEGFDLVMKPGASTGQQPAQAASQRNQPQWQIEVAAAQTLEQMRSQGKMAGDLMRMFQEIIQPDIPWTEHIRGIFNRRIGSGSYDWRRPDRRFIVRDLHLPSRSGHGAGWLVVWGDTSGSIGKRELEKYLGELGGIIEDVRPRRLTVLWCDSKIHQIDECEDATDLYKIKQRGVGGGGGTECVPVFDWIAEHTEEPDAFIGFTDCCVGFPDKAPAYPVIWACVDETRSAPWGEMVRIKVNK